METYGERTSITGSAVKRKHPDWVTIVHLTDLHFPTDEAQPRCEINQEILEKNWSVLAREIAKQQPDLICVTGDLVDNPFTEAIRSDPKWLGRVLLKLKLQIDSSDWEDRLRTTFGRVRKFLETVCIESNLDPSASLCVVPGNHDLRLQGLFSLQPFSRTSREVFGEVFGEYFKPLRSRLEFAVDSRSRAIICRVVGFDSNGEDLIANFAAGKLTYAEQKKFELFDLSAADKVARQTSDAEFRIALVHHHPLPVASAERLLRDANDHRIGDVLGSEQGMVFKHAGAFLYGARAKKVNLVLHGHQHHSQYTVIRNPLADTEHTMLVAGGGSIGELTDRCAKYNVVRLHRSGGVELAEQRRFGNENYVAGVWASLYGSYGEARLARRRWLVERDRDHMPDSKNPKLKHGIVDVKKFEREIRIAFDGSAEYTVRMTGLRASAADATIASLPMAMTVRADSQTCTPKIAMRCRALATVTNLSPGSTGERKWDFVFATPLSHNDPIDFEYSVKVYNVFDFVEEYWRARPDHEEPGEFSVFRSAYVTVKTFSQSIFFPAEWRFDPNPCFRVLGEDHKDDLLELDYHKSAFEFRANDHIARITVDHPLPLYGYRVEWTLQSKNNFDKRYVPKLLNTARTLASFQVDGGHAARLRQLLIDFRDLFSRGTNEQAASLHPACDVSLYVAHYKESPGATPRMVKASLTRVADTRDNVEFKTWNAGAGLIGQAHRSGQLACYNTSADDEDRCGYRFPALGPAHFSLWCIPLEVHDASLASSSDTSTKNGSNETPVYAVLCVGSYRDDGSLDPTDERLRDALVVYSQHALNNAIRAVLTDT